MDIKKQNINDLNEMQRTKDKFSNKVDELESLIEKTKTMLSIATATGLSGHYQNRVKTLDEEQKRAKKIVAYATAFLLILLSPFLISYFLNFNKVPVPNETFSFLKFISHSLSRAIIALPGVWFLSFSIKNYNSLFKLRENYAHKFSVTHSIEGLKSISMESSSKIDEAVIECIIENPPSTFSKPEKNKDFKPDDLLKEIVNLKTTIIDLKKHFKS